MAGFDPQILLGGDQQTLGSAPSSGSGMGGATARLASVVQPHHGLVGIVLLAVVVLLVLDRAGFRFAVTVGRS
jgi:hypothetical protein